MAFIKLSVADPTSDSWDFMTVIVIVIVCTEIERQYRCVKVRELRSDVGD